MERQLKRKTVRIATTAYLLILSGMLAYTSTLPWIGLKQLVPSVLAALVAGGIWLVPKRESRFNNMLGSLLWIIMLGISVWLMLLANLIPQSILDLWLGTFLSYIFVCVVYELQRKRTEGNNRLTYIVSGIWALLACTYIVFPETGFLHVSLKSFWRYLPFVIMFVLSVLLLLARQWPIAVQIVKGLLLALGTDLWMQGNYFVESWSLEVCTAIDILIKILIMAAMRMTILAPTRALVKEES